MWLRLLTTKDEAETALRQFQAAAERESGRHLKTLRTDRGGEFNSSTLGKFYAFFFFDWGTTYWYKIEKTITLTC